MTMATADLLPGFSDPVGQSQQVFRAVLDAMARPGQIRCLSAPEGAPDGWSPALAAVALTFFDQETAVWLDSGANTDAAKAYLRFHCGCQLIHESAKAQFAVITNAGKSPPLHAFSIGDPLYPERSATLVIQVEALAGGPALHWSGPGIRGTVTTAPKGLPPEFAKHWAGNHTLYPSGVDVVFVAGDSVMALPRGVSVEEA